MIAKALVAASVVILIAPMAMGADTVDCSARAESDANYRECLSAMRQQPDPAKMCAASRATAVLRCEEARRNDAADQAQRDARAKAEADAAASHASECASTLTSRVKAAQAEAPKVIPAYRAIKAKCASLLPRCAIVANHGICRGVSADDLTFFDTYCALPSSIVDDMPAIDENGECADVDAVGLQLSLAATSADVAKILAIRVTP